ncbi:hypothetical protein R1sor_023305 [Riccia sorocarpa]|uniref:Ycf20-like protein n=1 Tax=Riccia sorocarpa TaxID=122646 RepID=A0ABD3GRG5_9MARC
MFACQEENEWSSNGVVLEEILGVPGSCIFDLLSACSWNFWQFWLAFFYYWFRRGNVKAICLAVVKFCSASWNAAVAKDLREMESMSFSSTFQPGTKLWDSRAGLTSSRGCTVGVCRRCRMGSLSNLIIVRKETATARSLLIRSTLNTTGSPGGGGDPEGRSSSSPAFGTTRLGRIIGAGQRELSVKFKNVRRKFPLKIFLLLLGYYTANALATILGQTGDWDVLAAGVLVAVIEGIGYLMYRAPAMLGEKGKELVVYINFWKSGFSFGLFVDAFKLGS